MSEMALETALREAAAKAGQPWGRGDKPLLEVVLEAIEADKGEPDEPSAIVFQAAANKIILTMHADGRLERGDSFASDDEASIEFLNCLAHCSTSFLSQLRERAERAEMALERCRSQGPTHEGAN